MASNNAIVLINKGPHVTSFNCLRYVKKNVNAKTGHCGTLDKFATGLMIACCGKYTKKVPLFMGLDKTYIATIEFGKETDTLDPEGEVVANSEIPDFETVRKSVESMVGDLIQVPPVYSALHVNGKRSYEIVRSGKHVELEGRRVSIYDAHIISYEAPYLKIQLHVSKGTYIRSYARDLGNKCGSCAYVTELCRTQIGPFRIEESIPFDDEIALSGCDEAKTGQILEKLNNYKLLSRV